MPMIVVNDRDDKDYHKNVFRRKFIAMAIGNFMEWFDFSVFGALVDVISGHFFPEEASSITFLKTVAIFGAGFVMRPVGGFLIGWIGDSFGRRQALELSIILMLFPSFLIGCLPTYSQIGWYAPALLMILRLLQGLAAGGELVGAMIFTLESAKDGNTGFWGGACKATGNFGSAVGIGIAAMLRLVLSEEQLLLWGWRLPFLMGILFGVAGLIARKSLDQIDTAEEDDISQPKYWDLLRALFKFHVHDILTVILVTSFWSCGFYTCLVWLAYYMNDPKLLGRDSSVPYSWILCFMANLLLVAAMPLGGLLGDYLVEQMKGDERNRRLVLQLAVLLFVVVVLPAFVCLRSGQAALAGFGLVLLVLPIGIFGGNLPTFMVTHFDRWLRFTGVGIAYNTSHALFSSSVGVVQTSLIMAGERGGMGDHAYYLPAYYLLFICGVSYLALWNDGSSPHALLSDNSELSDNQHVSIPVEEPQEVISAFFEVDRDAKESDKLNP